MTEFFINFPLFQYIITNHTVCQDRVDMFCGTPHAKSIVTSFLITEFYRLKLPGRSSGRHSRSPNNISLSQYFHFYRRIPSGIQNFPCVHIFDCNEFLHKKDTPPCG